MTVSSNGIVHYISGETTFLTIPEWEREMRLYSKIKKIKFFKKYCMWKTFSSWKTLVWRKMIMDTSDFLNKELFLLDDQLSKPLLEVWKVTQEIQRMDMLKIKQENGPW